MVVHFFIMYVFNLIGVFTTDSAPFGVTVAAFDLATGFEVHVARFAAIFTLWTDCFYSVYLL